MGFNGLIDSPIQVLINLTNHFSIHLYVGSIFFFISILILREDPDQTPLSVVPGLGLYTICPCPLKMTLYLYGLTSFNPYKLNGLAYPYQKAGSIY